MLEVLAIIGFAVIIYIIYLFVRFSSFKSRLMNEFGRQGVSYIVADEIYSQMGTYINGMHHDGVPVDLIVQRILSEIEELERLHEK